jgi:hypothetical protein
MSDLPNKRELRRAVKWLLDLIDERLAVDESPYIGIMYGHARKDAKLFVRQFGEPLDPSKTDWDATAWTQVACALRGAAWTDKEIDYYKCYYDAKLVSETERLTTKKRKSKRNP